MAKTITKDSFFHSRLQQFVANSLFPAGAGDWYKNKGYGKKGEMDDEAPFRDFVEKQKTDKKSHYYKEFQGLDLSLKKVKTKLISGESCQLEVMKCQPESHEPKKPGTGKHIVYFPGANTYYQACFRDISTACKETGATVHAFNFPGTGLSSGKVREANDLINAGISVVSSLIKQGVHPDDIILQGDCYGASIALEVKKQLEEQADIKVRAIMNNVFKSFKAAVCDMITQSPWLPNILKSIVKRLLEFTGWHVTPGKKYKHADPYQCHIQHLGDQTLESSTLSGKVSKYQHEIQTGQTKSQKRAPITDTCPEEYRKDRDELDRKHYVRVKESAKERLASKFGVDKFGRVNAHFADLCELEMLDGQSVYQGFVNDYIARSNAYIEKHPQKGIEDIQHDLSKLHYLQPADSIEITEDEANDFNTVVDLITEEQQLRHDRFNDNDMHKSVSL
ncbi:TPA: Dot/Icm T4SS effector SdbB [Legionella pneumophila]|nr:Dot/Icm T4SS effector SdbB [Legionella pneumophila]